MKIIDRTTFLSLPAGVLYQKYVPCIFDHLEIKGNTCFMPNPEDGTAGDWLVQNIGGDFQESDKHGAFWHITDGTKTDMTAPSLTVDLNIQGRDGLFDSDQLFAVWEDKDILALIEKLKESVGVIQ